MVQTVDNMIIRAAGTYRYTVLQLFEYMYVDVAINRIHAVFLQFLSGAHIAFGVRTIQRHRRVVKSHKTNEHKPNLSSVKSLS